LSVPSMPLEWAAASMLCALAYWRSTSAPGDEVILPANTYIATALAVSEVGAEVVLVDCDPETYNIEPAAVESALTSRTRVLLPVHFTGQPAEMRPLLELAASDNLEVVEDAAQAHGALYEACGSLGKLACFSFYPGKNLGAYGDGGMVTTNDPVVVERTRRLRNYGERAKYDHVVKGVNSRLDGLQAAFLSVKFPHLPTWNEARLRHADMYSVELQGVGDLVWQKRSSSSTHVYHLFVVETVERDALRDFLTERGIQTGIQLPDPDSPTTGVQRSRPWARVRFHTRSDLRARLSLCRCTPS
jgi:dTDP-4-amino-4,6-dideoxygalactose transaminase